jgi:hypothetical protein
MEVYRLYQLLAYSCWLLDFLWLLNTRPKLAMMELVGTALSAQ